MYEFVDCPVGSLCNGGRFLLWAMRSWTKAMECGHCPRHALAGSFAGVGACAALPDFHKAMALLNRHGLEKISIAPITCLRIAEYEAILIGLWRDLADADFNRPRATLALLVHADAISPIAEAMASASAGLMAAGFDLAELAGKSVREVK